jgi:hypothetical protein
VLAARITVPEVAVRNCPKVCLQVVSEVIIRLNALRVDASFRVLGLDQDMVTHFRVVLVCGEESLIELQGRFEGLNARIFGSQLGIPLELDWVDYRSWP